MRNLKASRGDAANKTGSARSTWKLRSGMSRASKAREETCDLRPYFDTTGETAPVRPNQADQTKTLVDGSAITVTARTHAVDQQRLDVWSQFGQDRVARRQVGPGFQRHQRLDRAARTGIESGYFV